MKRRQLIQASRTPQARSTYLWFQWFRSTKENGRLDAERVGKPNKGIEAHVDKSPLHSSQKAHVEPA